MITVQQPDYKSWVTNGMDALIAHGVSPETAALIMKHANAEGGWGAYGLGYLDPKTKKPTKFSLNDADGFALHAIDFLKSRYPETFNSSNLEEYVDSLYLYPWKGVYNAEKGKIYIALPDNTGRTLAKIKNGLWQKEAVDDWRTGYFHHLNDNKRTLNTYIDMYLQENLPKKEISPLLTRTEDMPLPKVEIAPLEIRRGGLIPYNKPGGIVKCQEPAAPLFLKTYSVLKGDNLIKLAKKFGTTVNWLKENNNIGKDNTIRIGLLLTIPTTLVRDYFSLLTHYAPWNPIPIPKAEKKKSTVKVMPTRKLLLDAIWLAENPNGRGYHEEGYYTRYPDPNGKGWDVGPGLLIGVAIEDRGPEGKYFKDELDEAAYAHGMNDIRAIGDEYNKKFGSLSMPTPFDTVSVEPKLLTTLTKYAVRNFSLDGFPKLTEAISKGDVKGMLRESLTSYKNEKTGKKSWDTGRVERNSAFLYPGMFTFEFPEDKTVYYSSPDVYIPLDFTIKEVSKNK